MHVIAHGFDLVDVQRLQRSIDRFGQRFLDRVFTPHEQRYAHARRHPHQHYAARFAAKEAVMKALGTGWSTGVAWTDIEVRNDPTGRPTLSLTGAARLHAQRLGANRWLISLSHTHTAAAASALALAD